jgi:hypothetical protein
VGFPGGLQGEPELGVRRSVLAQEALFPHVLPEHEKRGANYPFCGSPKDPRWDSWDTETSEDRVRVTGFINAAPCFRFVGREGLVSDLFGEKLDGPFVEDLLRRITEPQGINARFRLLAPI